MDSDNGIRAGQKVNCTEVEPDSIDGFTRVADAKHLPRVQTEQEPQPPTDKERSDWSETVTKWLATEMANDIPTDHVIPLLWNDKFGESMEEIESTDACTLVIGGVDDYEGSHDIVILRLARTDEDPIEWIQEEEVASCPMSYDEPAEHIALSALGICQRAFWATDSKPEARTMRVLFPPGYTIEDMAPLADADRIGLGDGPHDPKRIVNG